MRERLFVKGREFKTIFIVSLLGLLLSWPFSVQAQFLLKTNNGTITIDRYIGSGGEVVIPSTINGMPVTSLGLSFAYCANVTSVIIPPGVTSIGGEAFCLCTSLTNISIPSSVTSIGDLAFDGCGSLAEIAIPTGVTSIGQQTFYQCTRLTNISIPSGVTNIGAFMFMNCSSLTKITIPSGVTSIGQQAFYGCTSLTNVTILPGITSIGEMAFYQCTGLTNISIPGTVTNIGGLAFAACSSLTAITIPSSVLNLSLGNHLGPSDRPFDGCTKLATITVDPANPVYSSVDGMLLNKNQTSLIECPQGKVGDITIPQGVTEIEKFAFYGCALQNVTIPTSLTNIGQSAFASSGLTNVTIPASVANMGSSAFDSCSQLVEVRILHGISRISEGAFKSCSSLAKITIPDSVTEIGYEAFAGCGLSEIVIPTSVTNIADRAFYGCASDYAFSDCGGFKVYFKGNAPTVGQNTFSTYPSPFYLPKKIYYLSGTTGWGSTLGGCLTRLMNPQVPFDLATNNGTLTINRYISYEENVVIPSTINGRPIVSIGQNAFKRCCYPTNIIIPNSVTSIGTNAFYGCNALLSIAIPQSITNIGSSTFWNCGSLRAITIPDSVTEIGNNAFCGCSALLSIAIPRNVTNIGSGAFWDCDSLTAINVDPANPVYSSVDGMLVDKSQTTLLACPNAKAGNLTIPPGVVDISSNAFYGCGSLSSVAIPSTVTNIGESAFKYCGLTNITIPGSIPTIGRNAFAFCGNLASVAIQEGVTSISDGAFWPCNSLTNVTIPSTVRSIGSCAISVFDSKAFYFAGDAPSIRSYESPSHSVVYYRPGTVGWDSTFAGCPTVLWNPAIQLKSGRTFSIKGTPNIPIVLETCTNLANPAWVPQLACTLTNGSISFSDPGRTNSNAQFYRIRSPQ